MISEERRAELSAIVKKALKKRNSSLRFVEYNNGVLTRCVLCKREKRMSASYWEKYDCLCTRGAHIGVSHKRTPEQLQAIYTKAKVTPLEEYKNSSTRVKVQCGRCEHIWPIVVPNLRGGHGCPKCAIKDKKKRHLAKYGVESPSQRPSVRRKIEKTMLKRYGVRHALQNTDLLSKALTNNYGYKKYKLGRRTIEVQGYEPQALDYIQKHYNAEPSDIRCGKKAKMPVIWYQFDGKLRAYHPDIFVVSQNRICEVKSTYSYTSSLERNLAKKKACLQQGYKFVFLIMEQNGNRLNPKDLH